MFLFSNVIWMNWVRLHKDAKRCDLKRSWFINLLFLFLFLQTQQSFFFFFLFSVLQTNPNPFPRCQCSKTSGDDPRAKAPKIFSSKKLILKSFKTLTRKKTFNNTRIIIWMKTSNITRTIISFHHIDQSRRVLKPLKRTLMVKSTNWN